MGANGTPACTNTRSQCAREVIEQHLADDPNDQKLVILKAMTLYYLGERAEAEKTFRLAQSPLGAMLSGSGSCVFALAKDRTDARRIAVQAGRELATRVPDCKLFVVRTLH